MAGLQMVWSNSVIFLKGWHKREDHNIIALPLVPNSR